MEELIQKQHEQIIKLCQLLSNLQDTIDQQNKKINKLTSIVKNMESRIIEKNERDLNKAIREYAIQKDHPIGFVHSRPLSKLLED